jgi:hypothetical protein
MALKGSILKYVPTIGSPDYALVKVTPSGNYVTAVGGDALNLNPSALTDPNGVGLLGQPLSQPTEPPSIEGEALAGYYAQLVPGATLDANKITFWVSEAGELGSGAYPAAILNGTLVVKVPLR